MQETTIKEMSKTEILSQFTSAHTAFWDMLREMDRAQMGHHPTDKWSVSKHFDHIIQSLKMLNNGLRYPKWFIKWRVGSANRHSRTYEQLVRRYHDRLKKLNIGEDNPAKPMAFNFSEKERKIKEMAGEVRLLRDHYSHVSERELDSILLPHPLLGKVTLREMAYFTIYHVQHHIEIIKKY